MAPGRRAACKSVGRGHVGDDGRGGRQEWRGRKTVRRVADGRRQHVGKSQPPETGVQGQPAVYASGDGYRPDVTDSGHLVVPVRSQAVGVGARPAAAAGVEGGRPGGAGRVDEGEEVAAHPAHVRAGDGQHRAGGHGGVGRRTAAAQH